MLKRTTTKIKAFNQTRQQVKQSCVLALEYKVLDMVETLYLEMNGIVIVVTLMTSKICIILLSYVHILRIWANTYI